MRYFCIFLYIFVFYAGCKTTCPPGIIAQDDCFLGMCERRICRSWELQTVDFDCMESPAGWVFYPRSLDGKEGIIITPKGMDIIKVLPEEEKNKLNEIEKQLKDIQMEDEEYGEF